MEVVYQDEIQSIDQAHINMTTQAIAERHVMVDVKKKRKRTKKAKVKDEFSGRMDAKSTESLVEVDVKNRISETRDEVSGSLKVMGAGSTENLSKGSCLTIENQKNKCMYIREKYLYALKKIIRFNTRRP